ncbi:transporter substrate-binding domain-containing protein [Brucepastera parasyntrophica]|uniref:transporter substrate-binding domain-containing protein n=1 Tax=Brucepastera parasyntrophica TaxID=2880008 RepID=UPI00210EBDE4|nr:transporter substrate-binding domain-containing protein [Brucepastera parasyntrophica]ULQ60802.1 transporter substrate-binding domain-containing protein [Brucepastera parasyntrophica]
MKAMHKTIVCLLVAGVLVFSGCAEKKKTEYLIATDTTFAPFEFEDSKGNFVGIDMDLLAAIAEDQGFTYQIQVLGFNAAVQSLESRQSDGVIAGMSITEERKKKFDFSDPYFDSGVVMGIAESNNDIKSYSDLSGKKVALKTGTEGAMFAESIMNTYGFTVIYFEDSANMYEEVKRGSSAACFEDYPVLGYAVSQGIGLKIVTERERGSSYGFAVNKGLNGELLSKFNAGLANLRANGKYQEILDTYIKTN